MQTVLVSMTDEFAKTHSCSTEQWCPLIARRLGMHHSTFGSLRSRLDSWCLRVCILTSCNCAQLKVW